MAFQAFDYERIRTRWNVFQTRDVRTKLDIYVCMLTLYYQQLHPRMKTYKIKTYISNVMPTTCFWNRLHQVRWKLKVTHITNNIDNKHTLSVTQRSNGHGSIAVTRFKKNDCSTNSIRYRDFSGQLIIVDVIWADPQFLRIVIVSYG